MYPELTGGINMNITPEILAPILQYDDPELPKSIQAAIRGGAEAGGFFG